MSRDYFSISIPDELRQYAISDLHPTESTIASSKSDDNEYKQVYINLHETNKIVSYYSDDGELIKNVYYQGTDIFREDKYRNNICVVSDTFDHGRISSRINYDTHGKQKSTVSFEYNKNNYITSITKIIDKYEFKVQYGYDELLRVNSRKITVNDMILQDQKFRFDILDRIVEYRDYNQKISVEKYDFDLGLISYKITDKIGNSIDIKNIFINNKYARTEIVLNGHYSTVCDKNYTDNIMLKRPYTTEDDLDLIIANLMRPKEPVQNNDRYSQEPEMDLSDTSIRTRVLPISMRKRILYNIAVNS